MNGNFFSGNTLYRNSDFRLNHEYLRDAMRKDSTKYIIYHYCNPLVEEKDGTYNLVTLGYNDVSAFEDIDARTAQDQFDWPEFLVYLGIDSTDNDWFAVNIPKGDCFMEKFLTETRLVAMGFIQCLMLSWNNAGIVAQAKSIFHWLDRYRFCPTCGLPMRVEEAGYKRVCGDKQCRSNQGVHNTCYPRTDPTVIMCVVSKDRTKCLLGRKTGWPKKQYSCLAGFMEPGESIEETVVRETKEESGICVSNVGYISSQPWPFPSSLMIGCTATATTEEIVINEQEMEDVQWFSRKDVISALHSRCNILRIPPKQTIARQLIEHWLSETILTTDAKSSL